MTVVVCTCIFFTGGRQTYGEENQNPKYGEKKVERN